MIIGDIRNILLALFVGLVVGGTATGLLTKRYVNNAWTAKVEKQKTEAGVQLQAATERAIKAERANAKIATELEIQNEIGKSKLNDAYRANRVAADASGGLRDPGRRAGGSCPASAPTPATEQPVGEATGAALSAEATQFLLDLTYDADQAAQYASTCYGWVKRIEGVKDGS